MSRKRLFDRPIAHRGLHVHARGIIENSRSAFEAAIRGGYAIECDVQLSSDGVPFIFHDDAFDRLTGASGRSDALPIAEATKLALKGSASADTPQTLADFLAQVNGRTQLQIELKRQPSPEATATLARTVVTAIRQYRGPCTLESFDPHLLLALRQEGVRAPVGVVTYGYDEPDWDGALSFGQKLVLRHLLHWPWTRFDFISCRNVALGLPAVRLFRRLGVPVTSWTIQSAAEAQAALGQSDQIVFEGFLPEIA